MREAEESWSYLAQKFHPKLHCFRKHTKKKKTEITIFINEIDLCFTSCAVYLYQI